jgi:predicted AAA+ superfamily ATPase
MKNLIKPIFIDVLHTRLMCQNPLIQVILGPRQVGKTTSILAYLDARFTGRNNYVSADSVLNATPKWLAEQWQKSRHDNSILVIDEIQKCQNWSEAVKALWDEDRRHQRKIQCVLLGSSSLQIQKGLTESLTGRFQLIQAFHWNAEESKQGYGLSFEEYLRFGGYPGSYQFIANAEWQKYVATSIVSTVIEKDILQYNTVKNPALFKQAFEILIGYPAMEVSFTKLLGQLQDRGNVELIKHYLELYQGAFLIKVLEKFSGSRIRTKSSAPKILPMAPCFYQLTVLDAYTSEEKGRAFEALVGMQLARTDAQLYYWRDGKFEVDYILKHGRNLWAIEVKSGRKKSEKGLYEFCKQYPDAKPVIVNLENYATFERDPISFISRF